MLIRLSQPAARDPLTTFPLDNLIVDISTMPQETLIAYGKSAPVLHSFGGVNIVRLSHDLVLKSGRGVLASEGETMSYVMKKFPGVRLPKVHRYFSVDCPLSYHGTEGYIVMDYVDGLSLDACWDKLSPDVHKDIATQVGAMVNQLQSVHFDHPGAIGGGVSRGIWFSDYGAGPFTTKAGFENWINWKLELGKACKQASADVPRISCNYFVLVHGDLSPRNVIVDTNDQVWLIDWGCAGFYPPIFEAASAKHQVQFPKFAELLLPLIYNNAEELLQLENCHYGINRVPFSLPPEIASTNRLEF
jgi:tRNA A-37 threonylcarbamoyl transferase component Bud32